MRLPDFIIIGAMKCATSTLHEQLAAQAGFFMSDPKEIYYFSDDPVYAKGIDWYARHFAGAPAASICGESTTHYTKLPTYPETIARIADCLPAAKFIYVMRDPVSRLVSQYIHQWTERQITVPLGLALRQHPELIAYSRYAMQLEPYFDTFGRDRVLPVFVPRLKSSPQSELERVVRFLGSREPVCWQDGRSGENTSSDRMRVSPLRDRLVYAPGVSWIRQQLPQSWRDGAKRLWQKRSRPELTAADRQLVSEQLDGDMARLGEWLGVSLTCDNFDKITAKAGLDWSERSAPTAELVTASLR